MHRCLRQGVVWAFAALLGGLPACLNPDISDEDPLTTQAAALDVDDEGEAIEEAAEDDAREDDAELEEDSAESNAPAQGGSGADSENPGRPRRGPTRR